VRLYTKNDYKEKSLGNLIQFPTQNTGQIDWPYIEAVRLRFYPGIPQKALEIIKLIIELVPFPSDGYILLDDARGYPRDYRTIRSNTNGVILTIDLLDRFGGRLVYKRHRCRVRRKKKRHPVFMITEVSRTMHQALSLALGREFMDSRLSKDWTILARDLTEVDLLPLLFSEQREEGKCYLGLFDRMTAEILIARLNDDLSIDDLISWSTQQ